MLKILIEYPSREEEIRIVDRMASGKPVAEIKAVTTPTEILAAREIVNKIWIDDKVRDYAIDLVRSTRDPVNSGLAGLEAMIEIGASPRASIYLIKSAKAHAFLQGRSFVTPHDVKTMAPDILRHRVVLTYEAEAEGKTPDQVIRTILDNLPVP